MAEQLKKPSRNSLVRRIRSFAGVASSLGVGFLAGLGFGSWFGDYRLDEGVATLIGSAVGAFIAITGAAWVAERATQRNRRRNAQFLADSLRTIRRWCEDHIDAAEASRSRPPEESADLVKDLIGNLEDAIEIFGEYDVARDLVDYSVVQALHRVRAAIEAVKDVLEPEKAWLDIPTRGVIDIHFKNVGEPLSDLRAALDTAIAKLAGF